MEPPKAACTTIALWMASSLSTSAVVWPRCTAAASAATARSPPSSHTGSPDGARAVCPTASPSASPTTWAVAAVPRNWQPPPEEAQAAQPSDAASSSEISPWAYRAPRVWMVPASSPRAGGSVTPPGTSTDGDVRRPGQRHHHRRQTLVAGGDADHADAVRQRADQPAHHDGGVVAVRQRVEHRRGPLRPAVARVGHEARRTAGTRVRSAPRPRSRRWCPARSGPVW